MSQEATNLMGHQIELERLYNKNQLLPRIKAEFANCKAPDFIQYMEDEFIDRNFGLTLLAQMALHKRCTLPTLVGIMSAHCNSLQETADTLLLCAKHDFVDWNPHLKLFVVRYEITADVQEELDRFQYPLPLVVQPKFVRTNKETGYYTSAGSIILKKNHHDGDICLDHINRANSMKFTINHAVVTMVKNEWRNLDKPKNGESRDDFNRRVRAFEKYDRTAHDVIAKLTELTEEFHLTHRPDKRGRIYSQGYHVNYQGSPWNKACIEFANKEICV